MAFTTIELDGEEYVIELESYKERDLVDFAPRATTGSDSILYSELGLYQALHQTSWHHGFGFPWWTGADSNVYQYTVGSIDTRNPGVVTMFGKVEPLEGSTDNPWTIRGMLRFKNYLIAWTDRGYIRSTDNGASWTEVDLVPPNTPINHMWTNGEWLFAAVDGSRIYKTNNLSSWTVAGVNANSVDYRWIANHNGFVYCGKDGKNEVYYSSDEFLADLAGTPADDPNVIYIGPKGAATLGAISYMNSLYILNKQGQIYRLDHTELSGTKVLDLSAEVTKGHAFGSWAVHNSYLVFTMGKDTVYQWNGIRLSDITPRPYTDTFPYDAYGEFDNFVVVKTDLICTARNSNGQYSILAWDGTGWHILGTDISQGAVPAMYYDTKSEKLLLQYYNTSSTRRMAKLNFRERSRFSAGPFPTSGQHSLYTSRLDAGFRRVTKSTPSILVEADNLASGRYLKVYYSINKGPFVPWGGTDGQTNVVTRNGVTELRDPLGTPGSTLEYKNIQFRFDFVTNVSTQSPVLESFTVRLLMRPDTNYGYSMNIAAGVNLEVGTRVVGSRTPFAIMRDLKKVRASKAPVVFIDPYGEKHLVYISAINRQLIEKLPEKPGVRPPIEARIQVNLVEV